MSWPDLLVHQAGQVFNHPPCCVIHSTQEKTLHHPVGIPDKRLSRKIEWAAIILAVEGVHIPVVSLPESTSWYNERVGKVDERVALRVFKHSR